ncbi:MAG: hypothetical protein JSV68_09105, partial [Anaerolineaceae bacterium]
MSNLLRRAKTLVYPKSSLGGLHQTAEGRGEAPALGGSRLRLRHITSNYPLMIGGIIVLGLFLIVLFGPLWAP